MFNVEEVNNWKSLQMEDKMVPFGLANAPKAFQKMVLGFHNSNAQHLSHNQDGSQDEESFDAVNEFQVDHLTRP